MGDRASSFWQVCFASAPRCRANAILRRSKNRRIRRFSESDLVASFEEGVLDKKDEITYNEIKKLKENAEGA